MRSLLIPALAMVFLIGCTKAKEDQLTASSKPETCEFGISNFNLTTRPALTDEEFNKGPKHSGGGGSTGGGGGSLPPAIATSCLLLDFDGHFVSGTSWNWSGSFTVSPSNLSAYAIETITNRVANDYSPFNIVVTTDENVFNTFTASKRMRVVLTESWEWFGQAGGTSFVGSYGQTNNTPCFVFTSLLNYNEKSIAEAASHEMGHTLGLKHQGVYSGTVLAGQYNYGLGSGETGWAPIMGCSYYQNVSTWHNGPSTDGYTAIQNEVNIITSKLGAVTDDYSNTSSMATSLTGIKYGTINTSSDVDYFVVNTTNGGTVSVTPFNIGTGNIAANMDIQLNIFNSNGQLVTTVNDPSVLNASAIISPGQYYISVSSTANAYASTYGMLGKYSIQLN